MNHFEEYFFEGQRLMSGIIKSHLYDRYRGLMNRLDIQDESAFLEPFIFGYLNSMSQEIPLEQFLIGYSSTFKHGLNAKSDRFGTIFIPNKGYYSTNSSDCSIMLHQDSNGEFHTKNGISIKKRKIEFINSSRIEIFDTFHPYFENYFFEWSNSNGTFKEEPARYYEIVQTTLHNKSKLETAFSWLKRNSFSYFKQIEDSNRRIVLFENPAIRSFAVRNLHGMAFISSLNEYSPVYYFEEVIHQCGHNIFNSITADTSAIFKIHPETSLGVYSKNSKEYRSIYSALHGLFTIAKRVECFIDSLNDNDLSDTHHHELLARLVDLIRRYNTGLETLPLDEVFTEKGKEIYSSLDDYCRINFDQISLLREEFDYSNQTGADFNYNQFLERNNVKRYNIDWLINK